jgi:Icc-related predicted phosphoesterase
MKLVCIADTHHMEELLEMPSGDVLVVAGDITRTGQLADALRFNEWVGKLRYPHVVLVAGNHDSCFQDGFMAGLMTNVVYLQDQQITIDGVKFYGSPWTPEFQRWSFMKKRGEQIAVFWEQVPADTDVLITHGPPYDILDEVPRTSEPQGCKDLLRELERIRPKVHVFGHLHMSGGMVEKRGETIFVNASVLNEAYRVAHSPVVVEV